MIEMLKKYKAMLEKELCKTLEEMEMCKDDYDYHNMVAGILTSICNINDILEDDNNTFSKDKAEKWVESMENSDGTEGGHWTIEQTNAVAKELDITFDHIKPYDFNAVMNMMYSDFGSVARKYYADKPEFFGDMAKAFLFDRDGKLPEEKLADYYRYVVKK